MKYIVTEGTPLKGETIEFLKNLLPEDRQEFLFDKINEAHAINEFMAALKDSRTYCLRMPCGKLLPWGALWNVLTMANIWYGCCAPRGVKKSRQPFIKP